MEAEDINSIRNYLFQHILNKSDIAVFVREKILQVRSSISDFLVTVLISNENVFEIFKTQVIAIMVKRGSVIDMGVERRKLLAEVEQLLISGELRKVIMLVVFFFRGISFSLSFGLD